MTSARRPVLIRMDALLEVFNHRSAPSKVMTPPRLAGATARLLARGGCDWRALPGEVDALIAEGVRRKVWPGIRAMSRSKRPWTLCRQLPRR